MVRRVAVPRAIGPVRVVSRIAIPRAIGPVRVVSRVAMPRAISPVRVVSRVAVGVARHARRGHVPVRLRGSCSSSHQCDTTNQCLNLIHCSIPLVNGAVRGRSDRSLMSIVSL